MLVIILGSKSKTRSKETKRSKIKTKLKLTPYKSGKPKVNDTIITAPELKGVHGYTIVTRGSNIGVGTLWQSLPDKYRLKGKVVKVRDSDYQGKDSYTLDMERISANPRGKRLRRYYVLYYLKSSGKFVT